MKHIEIRRNSHKKVAALGVLSLVALSQFGLATQSAQAAWSDDNYIQVQNRNRQRVVLRGRVTDDRRGTDAFVIRADNGRSYIVDTRNTSQPNIGRGDVVEVSGRLEGSTIFANSVRVTSDSGYNNGSGYNNTIRGRVEDDKRGPDAFVLRADNGRTYIVSTRNINEPELDRGDVVEVRGRITGAAIQASSVRIISSNGNDDGVSNNVLTGRVSRDYTGRSFELRADNGRSYTVRSRGGEPVRLSSGDRVQVRGEMRNGIFVADTVRIIDNDDVSGYGSRVNFTGTVQGGNSNRFSVRADNGRDYIVLNSNTSVDRGDRVRVVGSLRNGVVRAERVIVTDSFNGGNDDVIGRNVRLEGRVLQVGNGYLIVRDADDDQERTVRVTNANDFERGEQVIVTGRMRGNEIIASSIRRR